MSNANGRKYGFTALFPIKSGTDGAALRQHLRAMDRDERGSALAAVPIIHMARLVIVDDLPFQGLPAKLDRLESSYLLFTCDFDGNDPAQLVAAMLRSGRSIVAPIWSRCIGFPIPASEEAVIAYFKRCQITTNLFLADQPEASVTQILTALTWRRRFTDFVEQHQGADPLRLQQAFQGLWQDLAGLPPPKPGSL
jgi:hypothetical protein